MKCRRESLCCGLAGEGAALARGLPQGSRLLTCCSELIPAQQPHNLFQAKPTPPLQNLTVGRTRQG